MGKNKQDTLFDRLVEYLKEKGPQAVAFSGGVDSTLLLAASFHAVGKETLGITVSTPYTPRRELNETTSLAQTIGADHIIVDVPFPEEIRKNPPDRCYLCKKKLFTEIVRAAQKRGITKVYDGSNKDDLHDYRPGLKALRELGITSPLVELGFTKQDIRNALHDLRLSVWQKPASACLLSRLPYDTEVTKKELTRVDNAENYLKDRGIDHVRVRSYGDSARIEVAPEERSRFFDTVFLDDIVKELKLYGYRYISLDLEGYKTGKMNRNKEEGNE